MNHDQPCVIYNPETDQFLGRSNSDIIDYVWYDKVKLDSLLRLHTVRKVIETAKSENRIDKESEDKLLIVPTIITKRYLLWTIYEPDFTKAFPYDKNAYPHPPPTTTIRHLAVGGSVGPPV